MGFRVVLWGCQIVGGPFIKLPIPSAPSSSYPSPWPCLLPAWQQLAVSPSPLLPGPNTHCHTQGPESAGQSVAAYGKVPLVAHLGCSPGDVLLWAPLWRPLGFACTSGCVGREPRLCFVLFACCAGCITHVTLQQRRPPSQQGFVSGFPAVWFHCRTCSARSVQVLPNPSSCLTQHAHLPLSPPPSSAIIAVAGPWRQRLVAVPGRAGCSRPVQDATLLTPAAQ